MKRPIKNPKIKKGGNSQLPIRQSPQFLRVGMTAFRYYHSSEEHELTKKDYWDWLEALPASVGLIMRIKGFNICRGLLSFHRYVNEKNDNGMDAFMQFYLSMEDYSYYKGRYHSDLILEMKGSKQI